MANHDVQIDWNSGDPGWKGGSAPGAIELDDNDTVTLSWVNVPDGTTVGFSEVIFYHNKVVNGRDSKDTASGAGSWSASDGPSNLTDFSVAASGSTLTITDTEKPSADDKYWYSIQLQWDAGGTKTKTLDPELINRKKKGS